MAYGRAPIHAIMKGIWLKDFQTDVSRHVGYKKRMADPCGAFHLLREIVERYRVIEEERSRRAAADDKQDRRRRRDVEGCQHAGAMGIISFTRAGNPRSK